MGLTIPNMRIFQGIIHVRRKYLVRVTKDIHFINLKNKMPFGIHKNVENKIKICNAI